MITYRPRLAWFKILFFVQQSKALTTSKPDGIKDFGLPPPPMPKKEQEKELQPQRLPEWDASIRESNVFRREMPPPPMPIEKREKGLRNRRLPKWDPNRKQFKCG